MQSAALEGKRHKWWLRKRCCFLSKGRSSGLDYFIIFKEKYTEIFFLNVHTFSQETQALDLKKLLSGA